MKYFITILSVILSGLVSGTIAQIPAGTIEVRGRIVEQIDNQKRGVGNVKINVPPNRRYQTNKDGNFKFKVKYNDDHLNINISNQGYRIMNPRGGVIELMGEQMIKEKPFIQIEILVIGEHTHPELEERLDQWERKVNALERKRQLSKKQINILSEKIIQNTLKFEDEKYQLQLKMDQIQKNLNTQTHRSSILQDSLQSLLNQNKKLNKRVDELTEDLFNALAEKYIRQQKHYRLIAKALEDYLVKIKDLRDWLKHMDDYFLNPQAQQDFIHVVTEYEKAWLVINNHHKNYELIVEQEWDNKFALEFLQNTFRFLLDNVHKKTYLGIFQSKVYRPLQDWGTGKIGKRKVKKLIDVGSPIALEDFNQKVNQLEIKIEGTLFQLRNNL